VERRKKGTVRNVKDKEDLKKAIVRLRKRKAV
jgi:hypothetical protein